MNKIYGATPILVAENIEIDNSEMYFYQYLPIKLVGRGSFISIPKQLERLSPIIFKCLKDFCKTDITLEGTVIKDIAQVDFEKIYEHYIYLTAKCMFISPTSSINRPGWHSDGFGTEDINYIWSDHNPTQYIVGRFEDVPDDDIESLKYFEEKGLQSTLDLDLRYCSENSIYRLDETVIHSVTPYIGKPRLRHFVKVSFSKDRYNLKGNSHNYDLNYKWEMLERGEVRNVTSK